MRYGPGHKQQSRDRILRAAMLTMREQGPERLGVSEVMARAGLTHGGFYAHFSSKEALVAAALAEMFGDAGTAGGRLDAALAGPRADLRAALHSFLAGYLSPAHRDGVESGCPLPALVSDMTRNDGLARGHFNAGLERIQGRLAAALRGIGRAEPQAMARAAISRMVGAVALARAIGPGPESDALLQDSLQALEKELGL